MTLNLQLPEDMAERLSAMPEAERNRYALAALREKLDEEEMVSLALSAEDLAALGEGLADSDAGRVRDGKAAMAELYARVGLKPRG